MRHLSGKVRHALIAAVVLCITVLTSQQAMAYGITSISGSGWSGTLNYASNSTVYTCYSSGLTLYTDVTASTTVGPTTYYRKWQYSSDGSTWFTDALGGSGYATHSTISRYYRCVQRSTGGVVLAGSETPWVRVLFGPSFVSMPSAVSTTSITGTSFTANWTTSGTPHGPSTMNIRHYMFCSTTSTFDPGTQAPGFNSSCARLITACSESTSAIAGCTNPSTPVSFTVTGLTPGQTYYWKVVAQSWHEESSNGDLWCGYQSSYTATQTVEDCAAPVITLQPAGTSICSGSTASLSVTATGATSYQWLLNGTEIGGATSSGFNASAPGTYTVMVYSACDSTLSNSAVISTDQPSVAAAGPDQVSCGDSIIMAANSPLTGSGVWTVVTGSGTFTSLNDPLAGVSGLSAGTNTFQWTLANGVCPDSQDQVTINIEDSSLAATSVSGDDQICSGESTTLSINGGYVGGSAEWVWYADSCGGPVAGTGSSVNLSPSANTTYYVHATGGCNTTACVSVSVSVGAANAWAGNDQTICTGDSTTLTASGGGTYLWSYNGETSASITVKPLSGTTYTVTVTNGSCTATDAVTVYVTSMADATITTGGPFCTGDLPLNLSAVDPGGTWSGTGISNGTTGLFDPGMAGSGSHQVIYTIGGSCGSADTVMINVSTSADASIVPAGPFCSNGSPVILTAAESGGIWSGTGITNASVGEFSPGVSGSGTFNVIYTISGSCGDSDTISIAVNGAPDATIAAAGPYCSNLSAVNLSAATAGGLWSGQGITNPSAGIFSPSGVGAGTYQVVYSLSGSCPASDTASITVNEAMDATILTSGPFCNNITSLNLSAADPGGVWSGAGITDVNAGTFSPSSVGLGMYLITYSISGSCGDSDTAMISVVNAPNATIQPAGPFCSSVSAVNLSAVNPGGLWSGQGITDAFNGTFSPSGTGPGTWNVYYTLSGACTSTDTLSITVLEAANAGIVPAGPFCVLDGPVQLQGIDSGGIWSGSGTTISGLFDPSVAGTGIHNITYMISGSCGDTSQISLQVYPQANADILSTGPWCENDATILLSAASAGGNWSGPGVTLPSGGVFDPSVAGAGTHELIYTIPGSCGDADTATITIHEAPSLQLSVTQESCLGENDGSISALATGGLPPYTWLWNNGGQNPLLENLEPGTYSLVVTDANSCAASDTILMTASSVPCEEIPSVIYIPNVFSPNGDGNPANNTFMVLGEGIRNVELVIFDRWGEKIFETREAGTGWNGEYKGKPMDQGVYVYTAIIELLSGEIVERKGNFTLLR